MQTAPVLSATVAAAAALLTTRRAGRTVLVPAGALTTATVSLLCTVAYRGPSDNAVAYVLLVETAAALVLLVRTFRPPSRVANLAGAWLSAAVAVSPLRVGLWASPPGPAAETAIVCACWAMFAAIALCAGLYLRGLDRRRDRSVAAARRAQRLQLSRDLHDWIAHEMTGIVLEAHAGQLSQDPATMSAALKAIAASAARGLDAMERTLRLLREAGTADDVAEVARPAGPAEIPELVERFAEHTAIRVQLRIDENVGELAAEVGSTVYRIVLEALTNVRRHAADATTVRIGLARDGRDLRVSVVDDGDGGCGAPTPPVAGAGIGLTGLAERVRALGGTLDAGPDLSSGWAVHVVLPMKGSGG